MTKNEYVLLLQVSNNNLNEIDSIISFYPLSFCFFGRQNRKNSCSLQIWQQKQENDDKLLLVDLNTLLKVFIPYDIDYADDTTNCDYQIIQ